MSQVEETLGGLRIIKAFNAEHKMNKRFSDSNNQYRNTINKVNTRQQMAHPMSEFLGTVLIVIVLWFGGTLILNNNSCLTNEADAMLLVGGRIDRERGGVGAFAFDEIVSRLDTEMFTYLISNTSKIVNKGAINEPPEWYTDYSDGAKDRIYERKNGHTDIR